MNRSAGTQWAIILLAGLGLVALSATAHAGLITTVIDDSNDCAGYFGRSFPECNVFGLSPVIAKFEADDIEAGDGTGAEVNTGIFPSVTGLEWFFAGGTSSGVWVYTPGADDPDILFYTVKAANQFSLNYLVPDSDQASCAADPLNMSCLEAAVAFQTGIAHSWQTATGQDVSHITFYDSGGPDTTGMPVPGTLALLALGGLALTTRRRRTR